MKNKLFLLFPLLISCTFIFNVIASQPEPKLNIKNKILTKINNKSISVLDIKKKMDFMFHNMYPHLKDSDGAKYQFYTSSWQHILNELINTELMISEAESKEIKIPDGEVREEIENRFGPNVTLSLEKIGLSQDEAFEMIKNELIVKRMMWFYVHSKALSKVTPEIIRQNYRIYRENNPPFDQWEYNVITIKSKDSSLAQKVALEVYEILSNNKEKALDELNEEIKALADDNCSLSISSTYNEPSKNLSESHRKALQEITSDMPFSKPIEQVSRISKGQKLQRIFCLKNHEIKNPASFDEMAEKIKEDLLQKTAKDESEEYFSKLYKYYGVDMENLIEDDFQPFSIQ